MARIRAPPGRINGNCTVNPLQGGRLIFSGNPSSDRAGRCNGTTESANRGDRLPAFRERGPLFFRLCAPGRFSNARHGLPAPLPDSDPARRGSSFADGPALRRAVPKSPFSREGCLFAAAFGKDPSQRRSVLRIPDRAPYSTSATTKSKGSG